MKKYIEEAKKSGFSFLGFENDNLVFAKDVKYSDDMEDEDYKKEKMSLFEISSEFATKEFKSDDLKEKSIKMDNNNEDKEPDEDDYKKEMEVKFNELQEKYTDVEKSYTDEKIKCEELAKKYEDNLEKMAKLSEEKDEMAKKVEESDAKFEEMEAKFAEIQKNYSEIVSKQFEDETNKVLQFSDLGLDESEINELRNMRTEGKFVSVEDFKKEVAYKQFIKKEKLHEESNKGLTFGLDNKHTQISQIKDDFEKLAKEYGC